MNGLQQLLLLPCATGAVVMVVGWLLRERRIRNEHWLWRKRRLRRARFMLTAGGAVAALSVAGLFVV